MPMTDNKHKTIDLLLHDYRLTTAEIYYHLPDHPSLLQSFVWQEFDIAPQYPVLRKFLKFWEKEIEGKIHSVNIASGGLVAPAQFNNGKAMIYIH